jgi:hypothetical protein
MADVIDKAVRLYEAGRLKDAARLIAKTRRRAVQDDDTERLAEVESVIGQMQDHLRGEDRVSFDNVLTADRLGLTSVPRAQRMQPMQADLSGEDRVSFENAQTADGVEVTSREQQGMSPWRRYALAAVTCLVASWPALVVGATLDIRALWYWGVFSAYVGIGWLLPGVFAGYAAAHAATQHRSRHPRRIGIVTGIATGILLLVVTGSLAAELGTEPPS